MYNQRSLQFNQTLNILTDACKSLTNKKSYTNIQKYTTNMHKCLTNVHVIINELRNATSGRPNQPPDGAFEILVEI